jgi:tetratricopeptide (TPR) repeat protein
MRLHRLASRLALVLAWLPASAGLGQEDHVHAHGETETLGTVHFPTSCAAAVSGDFTRAVALLHSFGYEESRLAFEEVATKDPACGMAQWGIAMTEYHPIWAPPSPAELAAGKAASAKALDLGARTEREKGYKDAIAAFYSHEQRLDHHARAVAYRDAMEKLSRRFPEDHEAAIFYALALLGSAPPADPTFASQKKAAAILNGLLPAEPQHPGIAHYMIHAFDYPPLAADALPAARAYAKIAPSSPHALHMPSHIFTRLGLWQESIASNLDSAEAGRRLVAKRHPGAASFDTLHALDYLEYAYLQIGDLESARRVMEEAARAKTFDEAQFAAAFSLAAIPARWTLERRDWKGAAALTPPSAELPWDRFAYVPATTQFARALGAARSGDRETARAAMAEVEKIHAQLEKSPIPGPYDWTSQVESQRLAAAAWLAWADGRRDEALSTARAAADLEDKTGKHPVTPGAVLPARELLGDLLLEAGRPADALDEYEASLRQAPNRFDGLYGAARAAELSGKPERARALYAQLVAQCVAGSSRPELAEARRYLERPPGPGAAPGGGSGASR